MVVTIILVAAALLSLVLTLWQCIVALRFPLHRRLGDRGPTPAVSILKPLKGADAETFHCLESWLTQQYPGPVQILFGVASKDDPACELARALMAAHPDRDARLVFCGDSLGANAKVSTLIQLRREVRHDILVVSDADVSVPSDLLVNLVAPLRDPEVGLVNCLYRLANPSTIAMQWEAVAVNADFWSQVLQSQSLKPIDFALGAVMATTVGRLDAAGGFAALADVLADDYQLGNRIARDGGRIVLCPVVVDCRESSRGWKEVWKHQLRWARTIRVCRPSAYFFSILGNATLWPLLAAQFSSLQLSADWSLPWSGSFQVGSATVSVVSVRGGISLSWAFFLLLFCLAARVLTAFQLQRRMCQSPRHWIYLWLVPIKDLLNAAVWLMAFLGNTVEWRGRRYRVRRGGLLEGN